MYLLGIDFGTGGGKAVIINEKADVLGYGFEEYEIFTEKPGWSEHNASEYWNVACRVIKNALSQSKIDPSGIKGIAVSSALPSMVMVGKDGEPVARSYNLMDRRAVKQVDEVKEKIGEDRVFAISKNRLDDHPIIVNLLWEKGKPSACEADVMGAVSMLALKLATDKPSGFLDWNNNFDNDRDMCINTHCSNFPKVFFGGDFEIGNLDILGASLGKDRCFGALKGQVAAGPMTYTRISTDEVMGTIKAYVGEGEFTADPVDIMGGVAVCHIDNLQKLMNFMCENGFEHHVAMNRGHVADVLEEAFSKYMGWEVYRHK